MTELLRKYLLSTAVLYRPEDGGGTADVQPDEEVEDDPEDDEGTHDPEGEPDDEGDEPDGDEGDGQERPEPRGRRQFGEIRAERRRLAEDNARLTRELSEARQSRQQTYTPQETPEQRQARLELMAPEDRLRTEFREELQRRDAALQQTTVQLQDTSDRAAWEARCASNPAARKLSAEVERELAALRSRGTNLAREHVFTWIMGRRAVENLGKGRDKAADNRRRQTASPANARGDVGADRSARRGTPGTAEDFERRFGDIPI